MIPFYLDIGENKMWLPDFALKYFEIFATQYISFLERDEKLASERLSLEQIHANMVGRNRIDLLVDKCRFIAH